MVAAATGLVAGVLMLDGCTSSVANRDPTGEIFPSVVGESLEKERRALPEDLAGAPTILLVGYRQGTQFDLDRWLMGLIQAEVGARVLEVPTIPGLVPTIASGWIDDGMRSGIPREDWGSVVTLYGKAAAPVVRFTGNQQGRLTRVLVLDEKGQVRWFDDEGYSPRKALEVAALVEQLGGGE
ncbi:MAG: hypothetical protein KDA21_09635 [Phycisphaerales bacterium]|nr:hypothetical protein [Phycisphaerales bacterium]